MGGSSKASTADSTLAVSSDHDDGLPELLTYDSVVYELKSDQPGVKVSKDGNEEWIPVVKKRRKRTCKRKDESEPVSVSDDSGDELKVKFAREVCYKEATQCSHGIGHLYLQALLQTEQDLELVNSPF